MNAGPLEVSSFQNLYAFSKSAIKITKGLDPEMRICCRPTLHVWLMGDII